MAGMEDSAGIEPPAAMMDEANAGMRKRERERERERERMEEANAGIPTTKPMPIRRYAYNKAYAYTQVYNKAYAYTQVYLQQSLCL
jgi:hypothetical protein